MAHDKKEYNRKRQKSWRKRNQFKYRVSTMLQSVKKRNGTKLIREEMIDALQNALEKGICNYCNETLLASIASIDHKVPISRNGTSEWENLQIICKSCNTAKGSLTGEEFDAILKVMKEYPEAKKEILKRLKYSGNIYGRR